MTPYRDQEIAIGGGSAQRAEHCRQASPAEPSRPKSLVLDLAPAHAAAAYAGDSVRSKEIRAACVHLGANVTLEQLDGMWQNAAARGEVPLMSQTPGAATARCRFMLYATKYFALGWWTTMAEVLCSGSSRNPVVRCTPMVWSGCSSANSLVWSSRFGHAG